MARDPGARWATSAASELGTLERPVVVATELAWSRGWVGAVLLGALVGAKVASSGTRERDKQAVPVRNALGALLEEAERGIGNSYEATLWRKMEDGTRKAYTGTQYKFLRYGRINGFLSPREALKRRMLQVAKDGQYESPGKAILSGLRLAEKMSFIAAIVVPTDWPFAERLDRLRISRNPRNMRWAEGDIICRIAKRKDTWEWKERLGMAVRSLKSMLRIGEAWTVSLPGDGKLCFMGEKSRGGEHEQDVGPWPSRWMRFI